MTARLRASTTPRQFVLSIWHLGLLVVAFWAFHPTLAAAQSPAQATWLKGADGAMGWQVGAMYFAFWVATAIEVAILSKSAKRSDRPKKSESQDES